MFGLFKKKEVLKKVDFNYSSVMVDMHSHVLPGIDDGAQTPEESIILIKKMMELGITKIIATPHVMIDYYRNDHESINNALTILKAELANQNIQIDISAAAEHYFDESFEKRIDEGKLLTMPGNYVLFEVSFISPPQNLLMIIQRMITLGYKPILAHPERYNYMDIDQLRRIRMMGCNLQLNTISLTGYYGKTTRKMAEDLVDADMVDFISSDMHHPRHAQALEDALQFPHLHKIMFDYPLKNILLSRESGQ